MTKQELDTVKPGTKLIVSKPWMFPPVWDIGYEITIKKIKDKRYYIEMRNNEGFFWDYEIMQHFILQNPVQDMEIEL